MLADLTLWNGWMQLGFGGLCLVILSAGGTALTFLGRSLLRVVRENQTTIVGVIRENNEVQKQTNVVISGVTEMLGKLHLTTDDTRGVLITLTTAILSKPCLLTMDEETRAAILSAIKRGGESEPWREIQQRILQPGDPSESGSRMRTS